jgi:hypothetical protein
MEKCSWRREGCPRVDRIGGSVISRGCVLGLRIWKGLGRRFGRTAGAAKDSSGEVWARLYRYNSDGYECSRG